MGMRALLLGVEGVIARLDNYDAARRGLVALVGDGAKSGWQGSLFRDRDETWRGYGNGSVTDGEFYEYLRWLLDIHPTISEDRIDSVLAEMVSLDHAMIHLLSRLRGRVRRVGVGNLRPLHSRCLERLGLWHVLDGRATGPQAQLDGGLLQRALALAEVDVGDVLFVDASSRNVEMAQAELGMMTHVFKGVEDLEADSKVRGWLYASLR